MASTHKVDMECTDFDEVMEQIYKGNNVLILGGAGERVIIVIPHGSAVNTRASAA
ncbi:MAG: hypothetical protein K6B68_03735 [Eubacterium sp.]|nr:hypothetical protein [Eubacterium sp.]